MKRWRVSVPVPLDGYGPEISGKKIVGSRWHVVDGNGRQVPGASCEGRAEDTTCNARRLTDSE